VKVHVLNGGNPRHSEIGGIPALEESLPMNSQACNESPSWFELALQSACAPTATSSSTFTTSAEKGEGDGDVPGVEKGIASASFFLNRVSLRNLRIPEVFLADLQSNGFVLVKDVLEYDEGEGVMGGSLIESVDCVKVSVG